MAKNPMTLPIFSISLAFFFFFLITSPATGEEQIFGKPVDRKSLGIKKEKSSHFRFYWHDVLSGTKPTSIIVIPPAKNSSPMTVFGQKHNRQPANHRAGSGLQVRWKSAGDLCCSGSGRAWVLDGDEPGFH
ncbi:unnamed protein product [Cuscuta europaea]|uniref:Dirigent protein n=1 Tax=Cuscuta europaea TaxID=41803 RepID=A0A9P0ZBW9_CUSEU|nr:unnamed protein product [Cuscuta europaea]